MTAEEHDAQTLPQRAAQSAVGQIAILGSVEGALSQQGVDLHELAQALNEDVPKDMRGQGSVALLIGVVMGRMLTAEVLDEADAPRIGGDVEPQAVFHREERHAIRQALEKVIADTPGAHTPKRAVESALEKITDTLPAPEGS